jgi:hypothetical protein
MIMARIGLQWLPVLLALLHTANAERKRNFVLDVDELLGDVEIEHRGLRHGRVLSSKKSGKGRNESKSGMGQDTSKGSKKDSKKSAKKAAKKASSKKAGTKRAGVMWDYDTILANSMSMDTSMSMDMDDDGFDVSTDMDIPFDMSMEMSMTPTPAVPATPAPSTIPPVSSPPTIFPNCFNLTREEAMEIILVEITEGPILTNPATAQGMAYRWLLNDDPAAVDPCTYITLTQRYALATIYFSTVGDLWGTTTGWLEGINECMWFGVTCGDMDLVTELRLSK